MQNAITKYCVSKFPKEEFNLYNNSFIPFKILFNKLNKIDNSNYIRNYAGINEIIVSNGVGSADMLEPTFLIFKDLYNNSINFFNKSFLHKLSHSREKTPKQYPCVLNRRGRSLMKHSSGKTNACNLVKTGSLDVEEPVFMNFLGFGGVLAGNGGVLAATNLFNNVFFQAFRIF